MRDGSCNLGMNYSLLLLVRLLEDDTLDPFGLCSLDLVLAR